MMYSPLHKKGKIMKHLLYSLLVIFALLLSGCSNAGKNQTVDANTIVTLDGSASSPSMRGQITSYSWSQIRGKSVTLSNKRAISPTFKAPNVNKKTRLIFKLTTKETGGYYSPFRSSDYVSIVVMPHEETPDITPPVITLNGGDAALTVGDTYTEQGATATDDTDGNVEVTLSGNVDTSTAGVYTITYTATDAAGNSATATRTVTVTLPPDTTPPVITLNGGDVVLTIGDTYTEQGATATDDRDGNVEVTISGNVDTSTAGVYTVTYTAIDTAGNEATPLTRTVTVNPVQNIAPTAVITADQPMTEDINGQKLMTVSVGTTVYFSSRESTDADGQIVRYTWEDGVENVLTHRGSYTYTFTQIGFNVLKLMVVDNDNAFDTTMVKITVVENNNSTVSGRITSIDGTEILGTSIKVLKNTIDQNKSTTTNNNGLFSVQLDPDTEYTLVFSKDGFANQVRHIKTTKSSENLNLDIAMIARGELQAIDNTPQVTLTGADGASVSLSTSFVDQAGHTVTASDGVSLSITPVDVASPAALAAFPGDFTGIQEGQNEPTPIISYGTVEYKITRNSDGEILQLKAGSPATIQIPIYVSKYQDDTNITVGDSIPLWSLNEETGIWVQEGTGIVKSSDNSPTNLVLEATVTHFTWWNCDVTINPAHATITVNAPDTGTALVKARTNANIGGWRPNTVDTVIAVGDTISALAIPSNAEVCFWAEITFTNGSAATTNESCITTNPNENVTIHLSIAGGALSLAAFPDTNITGFINYPIQTVKIQPNTAETSVNYVVNSGILPTGITLQTINGTTAVLSGTPTQAGTFSVDIKGTDSDGNESIISIDYNISSETSVYEIRFNTNPVYTYIGRDPGTFWYEIVPFEVIDGVYKNGVRIAEGYSVSCDRSTVDLNVFGTYQSVCSYGGSSNILTIIISPVP